MARLSLPFPLRRGPAAATRPRAPTPGQLRRERRALLRLREERLRDLGGLALEMYRRDRFREDLIVERCAELIGIEARVHELDALLAPGILGRRRGQRRCACGAPLLFGANFCATCGRPARDRPLVACASCGAALAADVRFCGACGAAVTETEPALRAEAE